MSKRKFKRKRRPPASAQGSIKLQSGTVTIRPGAIWLDHHDKKLVVFSDEMILNQLRRDGRKIEVSFDNLCDVDLRELSTFMSKTASLLYSGLTVATRNERSIEAACGHLLMNTFNSFGAATAILRMGYVLQPGIIIRSMIESVSTVHHLLQNPSDFKSYVNGTLRSPKTLAAAKKAIPPMGELYGYFSKNFAHIGELHKSITPVSEFNEKHSALEVNLNFLRMAAWLLYVTVELLFNELLEEPRYWYPVPNGYRYDPSSQEREWMANYFKIPNVV